MTRMVLQALMLLWLANAAWAEPQVNEPIAIGSRLELFVDDHLIGKLTGAELLLQKPTPREVVMTNDAPWEGNECCYYSIFRSGDLYRMYYRGLHDGSLPGSTTPSHRYFLCYAESRDARHWTKPNLDLVEFKGSKANNVLSLDAPGMFNFVAFEDTSPHCKPEERYKSLGTGPLLGLYASKSHDGIHWSLMHNRPVITDGNFDSQNTALWDSVRHRYVAFYRDYRCRHCLKSLRRRVMPSGKHDEVFRCQCRSIPADELKNSQLWRDIRTSTSSDFVNWTDHGLLEYRGAPYEHLYTNTVMPYYRAPHIFISFPKRFVPERRPKDDPHGGVSDALFMTSRDGKVFRRWGEAIIRPGFQKDRWIDRNNMVAWGLTETSSAIPGTPNELSIYASEGYKRGDSTRMRRYTYRIDGFVSVHAPLKGGELITKVLTFTGKELVINFSTSAAGSIRVEIQDEHGNAVDGYSLSESPEIFGDSIEQVVRFKGGSDISHLSGKTIRLQFVMKDADLFSMRFQGGSHQRQ